MPGKLRVVSIIDTNFIIDDSGTATLVDYYFGNSAEFEAEVEEIEYEGDGTKTIVYKMTGFKVTIAADALDLTALEEIFGKTPVTTGLPVGETNRVYWGDNSDSAGIPCGLSCVAQAVDDADNTTKYLAIVVPVGILSTLTPPSLANADKSTVELSFAARKTSTDIAGDALPSVPSGGAFWYYAFLSAAPA